jgi:2'-5' RNA ligase
MRLFLASFLCQQNQVAYDSFVMALIGDVPDTLRPVPAGTQHVTMVFLGDVADAEVPTCLRGLEGVEGFDPVPFTLGTPRVLFARRSPRLLCVDLASGSRDVSALQKHLHRELSSRLQSRLPPPRPPHITIARFRKTARREAAREVNDCILRRGEPSASRSDQLTHVHLVKSTLTPEGPIYESIS